MNRPVLDLRQLYVFAVVAEELHFGRAAARLGISQPPLSQQIRRLEGIVGHALLTRDTRSVRLTDAGLSLQAMAKKMLDEVAAGLARAQAAGKGEAGTLNLGFTATTALTVLPRILTHLRRALPEIHVRLVELLPDPLFAALESERIDAAVAREMIDVGQFDVAPLMQEPYVAVLPARHRSAIGQGFLPLAQLRDDFFIMFPRDERSRNTGRLVEMCRAAGFNPKMSQEAPGWQTAVSFVGSGLGVTILPACVRSFLLPGVVYRDLDPATSSTIFLMRRREDTRRLVENFCAVAQKALAGA